jgi:hypothetical protein
MTKKMRGAVMLVLALAAGACSSTPGEQGLRDSFAQQLQVNRFISDFQRNGDDLTFAGPGPEGGNAKWRVHMDGAAVEANNDEQQPYKGTIKSSWFADGRKIEPSATDSRLPFELTSNGLSQDCWAFWDAAAQKWDWE